MTYFGFLLRFVGIPLLVLAALTWWDARRGRRLPPGLSRVPAGPLVAALVVVAVVWTTPWDNYLVATGVWGYDPGKVTGVLLGWVPIEEYTFFVLQTLLTGLWVLWLGRRLPAPAAAPRRPGLRRSTAAVAAVLWLASVALLFSGWRPGVYLGLETAWLLLPVIPQMLLGADLLWQQRRLVLAGVVAPWLYLSAADSVAISSGAWAIDPAQTTGIMIGGVLPVEELVFFLLTNQLIVFGMVLFLGTDHAAVIRFAGRLRIGAGRGR